MSEVQKRVLGSMPFLAGGKLRGPAAAGAEQDEFGNLMSEGQSPQSDAEGTERDDLLVKAKTGTGKTIVSA